MKYTVQITLKHWIEVEAENSEDALYIAEEEMPAFSSSFEEYEAEVLKE